MAPNSYDRQNKNKIICRTHVISARENVKLSTTRRRGGYVRNVIY